MDDFETIEYSTEQNPLTDDDDEPIGVIQLDRPERSNSMTGLFMMELDTICTRLNHAPEIKTVVLTGKGNAFSSGGDLTIEGDLLGYTDSGEHETGLEGHYKRVVEVWINDYYHVIGQQAFQKVENLPQPTIAAVNGWAVGAGVELVAACDLAIGSDEAKFSEIAATIGFITEWGGAWNLPKVVGIRKAKELLYTGREIDAEQAHDIGLLNEVAPDGELYDSALEFAGEIARKPKPSIQKTKELVDKYQKEGRRDAAQDDELENVINLTRMEDAAQSMRDFAKGQSPLSDE